MRLAGGVVMVVMTGPVMVIMGVVMMGVIVSHVRYVIMLHMKVQFGSGFANQHG